MTIFYTPRGARRLSSGRNEKTGTGGLKQQILAGKGQKQANRMKQAIMQRTSRSSGANLPDYAASSSSSSSSSSFAAANGSDDDADALPGDDGQSLSPFQKMITDSSVFC